jgi:hypothetical protein
VRRFLYSLGLAALFAAGIMPARALAQYPYLTYNQERAYRHFLNSPYRTRAFYGTTPGFVAERPTPYGYERAWRERGYVRMMISPRGFETYRVDPPVQVEGYLLPPAPVLYASPYGASYAPAYPPW